MNSSILNLSIVIPTIGRKDQVFDLINSIFKANLSEVDYEVIIINQNHSGYFDEILSQTLFFDKIKILDVDFRGLSKAKNYGALNSRGEYIIFLDDDSEIFNDTISIASEYIKKNNFDIVCGKCIDKTGKDSVQVFRKGEHLITHFNINGSFIEATCLIRREVLNEYKYDENLGAGTLFGAHEGYDWILNVLNSKRYTCFYSDRIRFYHPQVVVDKGQLNSLLRVNSYSYGFVYSRIKNKKSIEILKRFISVFGAFLFFVFIDRKKRDYYLTECLSIILGFIFTRSSKNNLR